MTLTGRALLRGMAVAFLGGALACRADRPELPQLPGTTVGPETTKLLAKLTVAGFEIKPDPSKAVPARYLRAPVTAVKDAGESLAVWESRTQGPPRTDGRRVSPRGIDGGFLELGTEAKWFLRGRGLVLYIGVNPKLRALLEEALGPVFVDGHDG